MYNKNKTKSSVSLSEKIKKPINFYDFYDLVTYAFYKSTNEGEMHIRGDWTII